MDPRLALFNPYLQESYGYGDDPRLHLFMNESVSDADYLAYRTQYGDAPYLGRKPNTWNTNTQSQTAASNSRTIAATIAKNMVNKKSPGFGNSEVVPRNLEGRSGVVTNQYRNALYAGVENPDSIADEYEPKRPRKRGGWY